MLLIEHLLFLSEIDLSRHYIRTSKSVPTNAISRSRIVLCLSTTQKKPDTKF